MSSGQQVLAGVFGGPDPLYNRHPGAAEDDGDEDHAAKVCLETANADD